MNHSDFRWPTPLHASSPLPPSAPIDEPDAPSPARDPLPPKAPVDDPTPAEPPRQEPPPPRPDPELPRPDVIEDPAVPGQPPKDPGMMTQSHIH